MQFRLRASLVVLGIGFGALGAVTGCSAAPDDLDSSSAAATPNEIVGQYNLAENCARIMKRHESVRAIDMRQGVIRWACADVPNVTDNDLGQEYCEYHAVQDGKIKTRASEIQANKPVSCVFTSVFADANPSQNLASAMATTENLGRAAADRGITQMQVDFNTRNAATGLLQSCRASSVDYNEQERIRMAACYQAVVAGGPNAARLEQLCKNADEMDDNAWHEATGLGLKVAEPNDPLFENQRDIASCMAVDGNGRTWRNSDPMICGRTDRTTGECGCRFSSVPSSVNGFAFTGWVDDQIPSECRLAKVDGQPYPYIAICDLNPKEIGDLPLNAQWSRNLGNFCHDRFAVDLVMKLPLRQLAGNSCNHSDAFCASYMSAH